MSTTTAENAAAIAASNPMSRKFHAPAWMREPLVHFIVFGAVLFGADHLLATREGDPHVIVVDADVDAQAIEVFKAARGHEPNKDELYALRKVWLDNEVLYREGIALGLDRGDTAIRERVIFKSLSMIDAGVKLPKYDEALLRSWFEAHRQKYDQPARFDFEEAVLAADRSEAAARSFAAALNAGNPGDVEAGLRVFTARPHDNIVQSYGPEFATALESAPVGEWQALPAKGGARVMRLKSSTPPSAAKFEDIASLVLQDWTDAVLSEQRSAAVAGLTRKYTVKARDSK